ncbi:MAG: DUF5686 family protein [Porphyromonadaceae bacterium]|nr:DUF5686 family protein [Porphyromonadaceae bacterium]
MKLILYRLAIFLLLTFVINVSVRAQDETIVIGQVFAANKKTPIADAGVWFENTDIITTTNSEGFFYIQSSSPQQAIVVEAIGYERKTIKLNQKAIDKKIDVYLQEYSNLLDEVAVVSPRNHMQHILKKFRQNEPLNNPDKLKDFSIIREETSKIYLKNISSKLLNSNILAEIKQNAIFSSDSSAIIPIYFLQKREKKNYFEDNQNITLIDSIQQTISILQGAKFIEILSVYMPNVNFYNENILMLNKIFISPLSNNALAFYDFNVKDSILEDNTLVHFIKFRPKNSKLLAFNGEMQIEAGTFALKYIRASVEPSANVNFVQQITFNQSFRPVGKGRYFYKSTENIVDFAYEFPLISLDNSLSAVLTRSNDYSNIRLLDDGSDIPATDSIMPINDSLFAYSIQQINNSNLQKSIHRTADILFNGYIHAGKVDFGVIYEFVRYNDLEGFRPTLSMRTGKAFHQKFSVGGYLGYGFGDKDWKFGGNIQRYWGRNDQHYIGLFYNNEVYRFGYENKQILSENSLSRGESILTSFSFGNEYNKLLKKRLINLKYSFDIEGFKFTLSPSFSYTYPNRYIEFTSKGNRIDKIKIASLAATFRFSFKEKQVRSFMRRFHLPSQYPIITLHLEGGRYRLHNTDGRYGKVIFAVKHNFAFSLGKVYMSLYSTKIFGQVPYIMLEQPLVAQGISQNVNNFSLINQAESFNDLYGALFLRYYTNGFISSLIPTIKNLNLRETFFINTVGGTLNKKHRDILDFDVINSFNTPYIEAGAGIANILSLFTIESVWRLTHRNHPNATNWGIIARFYFDF